MARFVPNPTFEKALLRSAKVGAALRVQAERATEEARRIAPVRTGSYQRGIQADSGVEGGQMIGRVNAHDFKSHWIEFGSDAPNSPPRAVLRRAVEAVGLRVSGGRR